MKLKQYQVDAFASRVFEGNPAAICPLDEWLPDEVMQAIAGENNLSETAFFVPSDGGFQLRWFTPLSEVDLCGHATLATAHVLFSILGHPEPQVSFETRSGVLSVARTDAGLSMDFPARVPTPCEPPPALLEGLRVPPTAILAADDYIAVYADEATVRALSPELSRFQGLDLRGVAVTAPGDAVDFVSRFFAPKHGIAEDPVTGSAHCELAPYWAAILGKDRLKARQVSARGGDVECRMAGDRVVLSGRAVTFMTGEIEIAL